ncbi:MFS transporter [Sphingobium sp. AN641]|uniref:MFS transporter n=1 Tax=Sphingobium sp. AN641 TaxID=3133443 RepID=UPI0030BC445B
MSGCTDESDPDMSGGWKALAPLRDRTFRTIWLASLASNFGQLVLGVAAAWEMTRLGQSAEMIALVQTALMLPLMLVSVPAGAIADMFDRRKIALIGLCFASACACVLTLLSVAGLASPWTMLAFCFLIGCGVALYTPAWQASMVEHVPVRQMSAAVSLGAVSYNIARSFGPALGGLIVMTVGATAAFGLNALFYLPLIAAFLMWKRPHVPPRLPPERIDRAIISGLRYSLHSPPVRSVILRSLAFGLASGVVIALLPLVARDMLHGDASTYGLLLGAYGVGAVIGALTVSDLRERIRPEITVRVGIVVMGLMMLVIGTSHHLALTSLALVIIGACYLLVLALFNVSIQTSVPRWVVARSVALYYASASGGMAFGSWMWGAMAAGYGADSAMLAAGVMTLALPVLFLPLPLPETGIAAIDPAPVDGELQVGLAISGRSGPIVVEVDYRVDPADARAFYGKMVQIQTAKMRNGAFEWTIARDIGDPALWTERYHFPTWQDYLRHRDRLTTADRALQAEVDAFSSLKSDDRVRRRLERPMGSVRWRAETPDPGGDNVNVFGP